MIAAAVVAVATVVDLTRPPERQLSGRALVAGVGAYQAFGSGLVPRGSCRFRPTCSRYAEAVIREHGALRGGWLTLRRLLRCGPWTPKGSVDRPPQRKHEGRPGGAALEIVGRDRVYSVLPPRSTSGGKFPLQPRSSGSVKSEPTAVTVPVIDMLLSTVNDTVHSMAPMRTSSS